MNAAVLFGLLSALSYGVTDYLSRIAGRAVGVWRSLFYADLLAFAVLSAGLLLWKLDTPQLAFAGHAAAWAASVGSAVILLAAAAAITQGLTHGTFRSSRRSPQAMGR